MDVYKKNLTIFDSKKQAAAPSLNPSLIPGINYSLNNFELFVYYIAKNGTIKLSQPPVFCC